MIVTAWLFLTVCMALVTLFAVWARRDTGHRLYAVLALILAAPVAFFLMQLPLGLPSSKTPPPGRYQVLGARIDIDVAIYALLGPETGEPRYYRLPYSTGSANDLQDALDGAGGEGKAQAEIGEGGEAMFHPPPVTPDAPKQPEIPAYSVQ